MWSEDSEKIVLIQRARKLRSIKKRAQEELSPEEMEAFREAPYKFRVWEREPERIPAGAAGVVRQKVSAEIGELMERALSLSREIAEIKSKADVIVEDAKREAEEFKRKEMYVEKAQEMDQIVTALAPQLDTLGDSCGKLLYEYHSALAFLRKSIEAKEVPVKKDEEYYISLLETILAKAKQKDADISRFIKGVIRQFEIEHGKTKSILKVIKELVIYPFRPKSHRVTAASIREVFDSFIGALKSLWNWLVDAFKALVGIQEEVEEFRSDVEATVSELDALQMVAVAQKRFDQNVETIERGLVSYPDMNFEECMAYAARKGMLVGDFDKDKEALRQVFAAGNRLESYQEKNASEMYPVRDVKQFEYIRIASKIIDRFASEVSEIARVEDRRVQRLLVMEKVKDKVVRGKLDYSLVLVLPRLGRKLQIVIPLTIENGEIREEGYFINSLGQKYELSESGIRRCLGKQKEDFEFQPRRRSRVTRSQEIDFSPSSF